jgi:hypothetical protein
LIWFGTSVNKQAQAQTNKQISLDILHQDLKFNSSLFLAHHRTEQCEHSAPKEMQKVSDEKKG